MLRILRAPTLPTALAALAAAALLVVPARSAPTDSERLPRTALPDIALPGTTVPDDRLRSIVAIIDRTRARMGAPGLRDEERDALAELAWAQADEAFEDPILRERAQRNPDFLQAQALLLMDDGEDESALAALERLMTLAAEDPDTHRLLALAYMGLGREKAAIESYRRALALGVDGASDVRAHLAYALALAGRIEEGLTESERAIAADPAAYLGHFIRGWILGEAGRREEERREYLEAVQRERNDADLWALLARSWELAGESGHARAAWREVVRIDPSDEDAVEKLRTAGP